MLEPFLAEQDNWRVRSATRLLLGRIYMELGLYNRASAVFTGPTRRRRRRQGGGLVRGRRRPEAWSPAHDNPRVSRLHRSTQPVDGQRVHGPRRREGGQGRLREAEKAYKSPRQARAQASSSRRRDGSPVGADTEAPTRTGDPLLQNLALRHRFTATGAGTGRRSSLWSRKDLLRTQWSLMISESDALQVLAPLGMGRSGMVCSADQGSGR